MFSDDVQAFFKAIGVNDDIELVFLPSSQRQQNIKARALGIEWGFQQERGYQEVMLRNPAVPDVEISVQYLDFCFRPPDKEQMRQIANSAEFLIKYETLADASIYVRDHLSEIVELISSDQVAATARNLRVVVKGIFDAIDPL